MIHRRSVHEEEGVIRKRFLARPPNVAFGSGSLARSPRYEQRVKKMPAAIVTHKHYPVRFSPILETNADGQSSQSNLARNRERYIPRLNVSA